MKSNQEINIKSSQILNIIDKLKNYVNKNKAELLKKWIEERLEKSLKQYYNQLAHAFDKLSVLSDGKEVKALRRLIVD